MNAGLIKGGGELPIIDGLPAGGIRWHFGVFLLGSILMLILNGGLLQTEFNLDGSRK